MPRAITGWTVGASPASWRRRSRAATCRSSLRSTARPSGPASASRSAATCASSGPRRAWARSSSSAGLAADYGAAWWLPRIVGHARAIELLYSGDLLDAERCLELGLASEVVPDGELLPRALEYAHAIAAGPPLAYTGVRRMLMRATELPMSHFLEYEWTTQLSLLGSEDASEGFRSFLERRDPNFEGR